jgi:hypothetical protein
VHRIANPSLLRPLEPSTSIAPASGADGSPEQANEQDGGPPMEREQPGIICVRLYSLLTGITRHFLLRRQVASFAGRGQDSGTAFSHPAYTRC